MAGPDQNTQNGPARVSGRKGPGSLLLAVCLAHQNQTTFIPAPQVTAVDSTAAGDCFNGAVAAGLARGLDLIASVEFGCRAAAVSVTRLGAQDAMPSAADVA